MYAGINRGGEAFKSVQYSIMTSSAFLFTGCKVEDLMKQARTKNPKIPNLHYTPRSVLKLLKDCTVVKGDIIVNTLSFNE